MQSAPGALSSGKPLDPFVDLFAREQEFCDPRCHMNHAILVNNRISFREPVRGVMLVSSCRAWSNYTIRNALTRKLSQCVGVRSPSNRRNRLVFSLPFGPTKPNAFRPNDFSLSKSLRFSTAQVTFSTSFLALAQITSTQLDTCKGQKVAIGLTKDPVPPAILTGASVRRKV